MWECSSLAEAHETLIRALDEFQAPNIERLADPRAGEVAFAAPESTIMIFARGNVVIVARNAGPEAIAVEEAVTRFDEDLADRPREDGKVVPEILRFEPAEDFRPDVGGALTIDAEDPLGRQVWFKFFSRGGEVRVERGKVVFRPAEPGTGRVTVFAINANRGVASRTFEVAAQAT